MLGIDVAAIVNIPHITLDRSSCEPLYQQLYTGLREAIVTGHLVANTRLPATRALAEAYKISRNTVINAYDQLFAEGYVRGKVGSGTYVSPFLPTHRLPPSRYQDAAPLPNHNVSSLSRRGKMIAAPSAPAQGWERPVAFQPMLAPVDAFPHQLWTRLMTRRLRSVTYNLLGNHDPAGYWPLREAIASYLRASRGVRCEAGQVIVVAGPQHALDLAARILLDEGDKVWMEDPGYPPAHMALTAAGAHPVPVPVDEEGLDVAAGIARDASARLAFVTPSHHMPLGNTMSLGRRLALLDWANETGAWIFEHDSEGEYRYAGRDIAALQGLDRNSRVIHAGTFNNALFPSLRVGYVVVPPALVDAFVAARALADRQSSTLHQAVIADFILEGHFEQHIDRIRSLCKRRQMALVRAAERELDGLLEVSPADTGMRLLGWLPDGVDDRVASEAAAACGLEVHPLSRYCLEPYHRSALLLGYTGITENDIANGVTWLAAALRPLRPRG